MDDQDSGRPSRRKQLRELFRRKGKSSAKGNQGFTSKSDEGPGAPPTQVAGIECRTDLWGAAYEQIQKEDPKLLVAYKKYLLVPKAETDQGTSSSIIVASGCYKPDPIKNKWLSLRLRLARL
jgi:hypothetical protein